MSLLTPPKKVENKKISVDLPEDLLEEMESYMEFSGFHSMSDLVQSGMHYVLSKDKSWKNEKKRLMENEESNEPA